MSMPAPDLNEVSPSEQLARDLINDTSALVSPPDVWVKINELTRDERTSLEQIALVVIRDPNLTARILKVANSPYYGLPSRVDTVTRAVMLLGMGEVQNLVCAICAIESFSKLSCAVTNMNSFWRHGLYTGLTAQALARRANVLHPERLFVAGILHDVGTLLINKRFPDIAEATIIEAAGNEDALQRLELRELGFDHALLGGMMLDSWELPPTLVDTVRWHHQPHRAGATAPEVAIVKLADTLANYSGTGNYSERVAGDAVDLDLLRNFGLDVNFTQDEILDEVDAQFIEAIYLLVT